MGGVHIGARALHVLNLIWFGNNARLLQWGVGRGGNFLVQMIFTCRRYVLRVEEGGGGSQHPVTSTPLLLLVLADMGMSLPDTQLRWQRDLKGRRPLSLLSYWGMGTEGGGGGGGYPKTAKNVSFLLLLLHAPPLRWKDAWRRIQLLFRPKKPDQNDKKWKK